MVTAVKPDTIETSTPKVDVGDIRLRAIEKLHPCPTDDVVYSYCTIGAVWGFIRPPGSRRLWSKPEPGAAARYLRKVNPSLSREEARSFAIHIITLHDGVRENPHDASKGWKERPQRSLARDMLRVALGAES